MACYIAGSVGYTRISRNSKFQRPPYSSPTKTGTARPYQTHLYAWCRLCDSALIEALNERGRAAMPELAEELFGSGLVFS